jgi:cytochrome c oxidase subunit II
MRSWLPWITGVAGVACICVGVLLGVRNLLHPNPSPSLTVDAIAHQWWWEFDYPTLGIRTSNELHVPSDSVVHFQLTSADVVHTFWMPGMKDAVMVVPGQWQSFDLKMKSPGESYGTCDASCGCSGDCMRFRILATASDDFTNWLARERLETGDVEPPERNAEPSCMKSSS